MNKRGQLAIYILIGIVIVVVGILAYIFYPQISGTFGSEFTPTNVLRNCLEPTIEEGIVTLGMQGGYANPEGFIQYKGRPVKYLCYSSEYYETCNIQQPLLVGHVQKELEDIARVKAEECVSELREEYESQGYEVSGFSDVESSVEIVPGDIIVKIVAPMTVSKETTQTFREFNTAIPSEMYDLVLISASIVDYEATYGDSAVDLYHQYYPNIRISKMKLGDGSTIYEVENVITEEKFVFASRSLAWPPGYGGALT